MFEFDEHYSALEILESSAEGLLAEDIVENWTYMGHDVWKFDTDSDLLDIAVEWQLESVEVA